MLSFLTIVSIALSVLLTIGLIYTSIKSAGIVNLFTTKYIAKGKMYGLDADLREWIQTTSESIKQQAYLLRGSNEVETTINTYNFLETNYTYENDSLTILNNGHVVFQGTNDTWNLPTLTLAMKKYNNGKAWMDCEDGTYLLTSLLRVNGINAWANIGTISITDPSTKETEVYGHAWVLVEINGKSYILETTLGKPIHALSEIKNNEYVKYSADVRFNEETVIPVTGVDINKRKLDPLPPEKVLYLQTLFDNE